MRPRRILGLLVLALAPLSLPGCCDNDSSSAETPTTITIEEERDYASGDSAYDWNSPGESARVTLRIDNFHHGDFRLRIFDADHHQIFKRQILTNDWYWYVGDWEVEDIAFTEDGRPGPWTILLEYGNFTGDVEVIVESTETQPPPTPDDVGPPTSNSALLDLAYGNDGRASYGFGAAFSTDAVADGSGRVVTAGLLIDSEDRKRLAVWRFSSSGQLDTSFASGGLFILDDAAVSSAVGLALDANNRVIVTGWEADAQAHTNLVLLRLTEDGQLDSTFAGSGVAVLDEGNDEAGFAVVRDHHGRLLVTGASRDASGERVMILARYTSAGALDESFGSGGIVRTKQVADIGWDVAVDAQDQPVVAGARADEMILWKYTTSGTFDQSFGDGGVVTSSGPSGEFRVGRSLAIAQDGTLAVCGVRSFDTGQPSELIVWRFAASGSALASFGDDGLVTYHCSNGVASGSDVAIDSAGRLLVVGTTRPANQNDGSATLWRFLDDGLLDGSLPGSDGSGVTRFDARSNGVSTSATSIAIAGTAVFAGGGAVDHVTGAVDLLVWKLEP